MLQSLPSPESAVEMSTRNQALTILAVPGVGSSGTSCQTPIGALGLLLTPVGCYCMVA